ncbi:hypothetical protein [Streptomyces wedmorensis]
MTRRGPASALTDRGAAGSVTTDLLVGGMTCAACVNRVEKKLPRP